MNYYVEKLETALNNLSDFLVQDYWLVLDEDEEEFNVVIDEYDTGDPEDYYGAYSAIAQRVSNGSNSGEDLAKYLAAASPKVIRYLIDYNKHLQRKVKELEDAGRFTMTENKA